jgi:pyruvate/2-oxoglutarate dehydrogenase complex dihydrolipoamide dehydrogenase (E3) component/uncharacterized membrane protein YdjX (TVP38/TMEM64 family)
MPTLLKKGLLFAVVLIVVILFFVFDLQRFLTLEELKFRRDVFSGYYIDHRLLMLLLYFLFYVVVTALSLPGAAILTLAGGALFGFWTALVVVSFASSFGATLAFLISRFLLRDWVQARFGERLEVFNRGVAKEGAFYLFSLRLVPLFPFFVINLVFGLTPLKVFSFYWVSQLGMLAGTAVFINAGTQLGRLDSLSGILSPRLLLSFVVLGLFPLLSKKLLDFIKQRKILTAYPRPKAFDYNLVVIGAGSAGLVSSYIAAAVKAKVALIEKHQMGGDCLNTGCVPSKALIRSAKILNYSRRAEDFGFKKTVTEFDFNAVMERVQKVISKVEPHDSVERYSALGVECISGEAKITSPYTVEVNGRTLTTRNIIIATGASPFVPPILGLDQIDYLTSDNLWQLRELPKRLIVLGGGPIGCEMTQAFSRFGSQVTQVEMAPKIMGREDPDVADFVQACFEDEGVKVLTKHAAQEVCVVGEEKILVCDYEGTRVDIPFDALLVAVGRKANVEDLGLEELGVKISTRGTIDSDPLLRTNFPNILCAGDVAGPYQFTHTAAHQAWYATVNALFSPLKTFRVDYRVIPWCTFTDPEVARVGLNETEAREQKFDFEITCYRFAELDRAIVEEEDDGWIKVITPRGKDKILGATIVGPHAGDMLAEFILAMKQGIGLNKILGTIHPYPTFMEANKAIAGVWKQAHAPEKLLHLIEKYHNWRRGC